jgi:hypothetical protein
MEAQGIKLDSSYGSAGKTGRGYLHSTGLPFHPLDTNGLPFNLYELPFQIQARYSEISLRFIEDLLLDSQYEYHVIINALYHPVDLEEGKPSRYDWLKFDELAAEKNHGLMTLIEVLRWWEDRRKTAIDEYSWDGEILQVKLDIPVDGIGLVLPSEHNSLQLEEVFVDGAKITTSRQVALHGMEYTLTGMETGCHQVRAVYGG